MRNYSKKEIKGLYTKCKFNERYKSIDKSDQYENIEIVVVKVVLDKPSVYLALKPAKIKEKSIDRAKKHSNLFIGH